MQGVVRRRYTLARGGTRRVPKRATPRSAGRTTHGRGLLTRPGLDKLVNYYTLGPQEAHKTNARAAPLTRLESNGRPKKSERGEVAKRTDQWRERKRAPVARPLSSPFAPGGRKTVVFNPYV